jgi:hypothetical protein
LRRVRHGFRSRSPSRPQANHARNGARSGSNTSAAARAARAQGGANGVWGDHARNSEPVQRPSHAAAAGSIGSGTRGVDRTRGEENRTSANDAGVRPGTRGPGATAAVARATGTARPNVGAASNSTGSCRTVCAGGSQSRAGRIRKHPANGARSRGNRGCRCSRRAWGNRRHPGERTAAAR